MSVGAYPATHERSLFHVSALRVGIGARGANPNVPPATLPFKPTAKAEGDIVITSIGRK